MPNNYINWYKKDLDNNNTNTINKTISIINIPPQPPQQHKMMIIQIILTSLQKLKNKKIFSNNHQNTGNKLRNMNNNKDIISL